VISGHYFKRIRHRRAGHAAGADLSNGNLLALLSRSVIERFTRISDVVAIAVPVARSGPDDADDPPRNPGHPACSEHANSDYCRESWQLHLAELKRHPETHWHKCDYGRLCAIVPVVYHGQCLAAVKLACSDSMAEEEFERHVEILDTLVKDFVLSEARSLGRLLRAGRTAAGFGASPAPSTEEPIDNGVSHPLVLRALEYIETHLCDPALGVGRTARELGTHPSYLSQLFGSGVGQRMNRFIAARRVELAKTLLATADWQIKRIAREAGFANPNWFSYVFRTLVGLTPGEYRRKTRGHSSSAQDFSDLLCESRIGMCSRAGLPTVEVRINEA
jgi:AraC-like DNA-binding protein